MSELGKGCDGYFNTSVEFDKLTDIRSIFNSQLAVMVDEFK